jgi:GT2 family glycosyltransferase
MHLPFFSIIIPTSGRHAALRNCLEAISRIEYPPDRCQVIVVFDGRPPLDLPDLAPLTVRTFSQPPGGPAAARNLGARHASGDYLAFTDDDCQPASDWLLKLTAVFNQFPEVMTGGQTLNALTDNGYAAASQLLVDFLYERYNPDPLHAQFLTANNMALSRDKFLASGGFDTTFSLAAGEDREFCSRWLHKGGRIIYEPEAVVYHAHHLDRTRFWQQHLNYGRGACRYHQKRIRQETERPRQLSFSFYVNLLRYPFRRTRGRCAPQLFLLFLLMQFATAIGFLIEHRNMNSS